MSSSESIRGSLDNDSTGGMGFDVLTGFSIAYFLMDLSRVQMASVWVFTTYGDKSSGGGISPCTESFVWLLIGHLLVSGLTKVIRRRTHLGFVFLWIFLLYRRMWQPRGSAPEGGDDVMAVSIRFSAMARAVLRAG